MARRRRSARSQLLHDRSTGFLHRGHRWVRRDAVTSFGVKGTRFGVGAPPSKRCATQFSTAASCASSSIEFAAPGTRSTYCRPSRAHELRQGAGERRDFARDALRVAAVTAHAMQHVVLCRAGAGVRGVQQREAHAQQDCSAARARSAPCMQAQSPSAPSSASRSARISPVAGWARAAASSPALIGCTVPGACERSKIT